MTFAEKLEPGPPEVEVVSRSTEGLIRLGGSPGHDDVVAVADDVDAVSAAGMHIAARALKLWATAPVPCPTAAQPVEPDQGTAQVLQPGRADTDMAGIPLAEFRANNAVDRVLPSPWASAGGGRVVVPHGGDLEPDAEPATAATHPPDAELVPAATPPPQIRWKLMGVQPVYQALPTRSWFPTVAPR